MQRDRMSEAKGVPLRVLTEGPEEPEPRLDMRGGLGEEAEPLSSHACSSRLFFTVSQTLVLVLGELCMSVAPWNPKAEDLSKVRPISPCSECLRVPLKIQGRAKVG